MVAILLCYLSLSRGQCFCHAYVLYKFPPPHVGIAPPVCRPFRIGYTGIQCYSKLFHPIKAKKGFVSLVVTKIFNRIVFRNFLCLSVFLPSTSSVEFQTTVGSFEAKSSAAVSVSISHFFSTSKLCFQTSATDSLSSCLRFRKSAVLCCTFLPREKCRGNNAYSLCNGSEPDFLFLSDRFRQLRNSNFSHRPLNSIFSFHLKLLTVLLQYSVAACHGREVLIFVMLMYYTNFCHNMLELFR